MKYLRQNTVIKKARPMNFQHDSKTTMVNNFANPEYLKELTQQRKLSVFKNLIENLYTSDHYRNVLKENKAKIYLDDQEIDFSDAFGIGKAIKQKERIRIQKQKEMVTTRRKLFQNNAYDNINNPEFNSYKNKIHNFSSPKTKEEIMQSFITGVPSTSLKRNIYEQNGKDENQEDEIQMESRQKALSKCFTMPFYSLPIMSLSNPASIDGKIVEIKPESPEEKKLYEKISQFKEFENKIKTKYQSGKYSRKLVPDYEELMYDMISRENHSKYANKELESVKITMHKLNTDFIKASSNLDRFYQTHYYHKTFHQKKIIGNLKKINSIRRHYSSRKFNRGNEILRKPSSYKKFYNPKFYDLNLSKNNSIKKIQHFLPYNFSSKVKKRPVTTNTNISGYHSTFSIIGGIRINDLTRKISNEIKESKRDGLLSGNDLIKLKECFTPTFKSSITDVKRKKHLYLRSKINIKSIILKGERSLCRPFTSLQGSPQKLINFSPQTNHSNNVLKSYLSSCLTCKKINKINFSSSQPRSEF